jgi:hypothetical protein
MACKTCVFIYDNIDSSIRSDASDVTTAWNVLRKASDVSVTEKFKMVDTLKRNMIQPLEWNQNLQFTITEANLLYLCRYCTLFRLWQRINRRPTHPSLLLSRVGAVALYTVLWTVVAKYRKWRFSALHRTKTLNRSIQKF